MTAHAMTTTKRRQPDGRKPAVVQVALLYLCCGLIGAACFGWWGESPASSTPAPADRAGAIAAVDSGRNSTLQTLRNLFDRTAREAGWSPGQIEQAQQVGEIMRRNAGRQQSYYDETALDMVEWAGMIAGYVAVALSDSGMSVDINRQLAALAEGTDIADIWVTDSIGRVEYASSSRRLPDAAARGDQLLAPFTDLLGSPTRLTLLPTVVGAGRYAAVTGVDQSRAVIIGIDPARP